MFATVIAAGTTAVVYTAAPGSGAGAPDVMTVAASVATTGMAEVVVDDIDGDRADDVVAVERSTGKLWLYAGAGRVEIGTGGWNSMHDLATGDFNGDTKADLVAVEEATGKLWLYASVGKGLAGRDEIGTGGWNGMHDLVSGDFTKDGKADVVAVENSTGKLWLYPGDGTGSIGSGSTRVEIGSGGWNSMHDLVAMDLDHDAKSDIVGAETATGKLFWYRGNGVGLGGRVEIGSGGWNTLRDLAGGDLDGDPRDDLVGIETATGKLYLYPGIAGSALGGRLQIGSAAW
ncbi:VCBS repeat-containing protein [Streptomyces sp. NPDC006553]|uniref:FG-GAP repeat domain-containing protein n=1 Tax=unclassified Streptomyces TaxID=2593676 RepID=UPI00224D7DE3|nr:VCBS repeat-containing protein [Streptomyces sp. NBC_00233]MCX5229532.1 VCBS repeat-containing protein [Streptomyces sp. NBC_00233]